MAATRREDWEEVMKESCVAEFRELTVEREATVECGRVASSVIV